MQIFKNVPLSREFSYPEESTIRRYYIETCSVARRPNLENYIQDGIDPYRFYSVVRKNYSSTDLPFVVPKVFSHFTTNVGLFSTIDNDTKDYFDKGVTLTDDGELLDDNEFPLQSDSPPVYHSKTLEKTKKVTQVLPSDDHDTSNFFEQPFQDNFDNEKNYQQVQSQFQNETDLRLSDKNSFKTKSPKSKGQTPIKLSRSLSKSSINFESPSVESNIPVLELEDLKSSRGSDKSKRSIRGSSTSNSLYKLDRKGTSGQRRGMVSKVSKKESKQALKVTKKGPYQIIRGPRKIVGVGKQLTLTDNKTKESKKYIKDSNKKEELALLDKSKASQTDYDMGGFDALVDAPRRLKGASVVRRKPRPSLSSSGALNSLYITARSVSDEKDVLYLEDKQPTTNRYPKRIRRPVSPYWISNVASDGSSVVYLAGVFSQKSSKPSYLNYDMVPDTSLVLTNDHGDVKLQVVNKDSNDPNNEILTEYVKNMTPATTRNTPKRLLDGRKRLVKPRRALSDSKGSVSDSEILRLEDANRDNERKKIKKKKKIRIKGIPIKELDDVSLEDALEFMNQAKSDDEFERLRVENKRKEKRKIQTEDKKRKETTKKATKNWNKFHSENLKEEDKLDAFVEEQNDVYYYKAMYRQDEQISLYEDGVRFTPMIMNSQCRTSDILIPSGQTLDFGNLNSNFICGFVYSGSGIEINVEGEQSTVNQNDLFFLPSYKECSIVNKNSESEAQITFTFVNI